MALKLTLLFNKFSLLWICTKLGYLPLPTEQDKWTATIEFNFKKKEKLKLNLIATDIFIEVIVEKHVA